MLHLQGREVDLIAVLLAVSILALTTIEGLRTKDKRRDGPLPLLALGLVVLLVLRLLDHELPILFVGGTLLLLILIATILRFCTHRGELQCVLERERVFYKNLLTERLRADRPDASAPANSTVMAAVEEKLYEELTIADRKLAFTLGAAAAVAAIHGFLLRAVMNAPTGAPDAAFIVASLGLVFALTAGFLALWPRAIWLGEERLKLEERDKPSDHDALVRSLIKERRIRDRSYTAAKRFTFYSAFILVVAHIAVWVA